MTSRLVTVILLTAEIKDLTAQITQRTKMVGRLELEAEANAGMGF